MRTKLIDKALLFLARRSHTISQRVTLSVPTRLSGNMLRIPVVAGAGFQNLALGPDDFELRQVAHQVIARSEGAIIDVGCNIGHFLELCVLADRSRRYIGFDVSLACCYYVERFIRENGLTAHSVFPIGLTDGAGVEEYLSNSAFDVCASLSKRSHASDRFLGSGVVLTETGDEVVARLGLSGIALIKIDVEGLEPRVLDGFKETISRERPALIFEVLSYAHLEEQIGDVRERDAVIAHRREAALAIENFLSNRDYVTYRMRDGGYLEYRHTIDPGNFRADTSCDHLAVPRERAPLLLDGYPCRADELPQQALA